MTEPLSLRAFGRQLGVSDTAVRKAIRSGRLRRSVGEHRGRPVIVSVSLATEEWHAGAAQRPARARSTAPAPNSPSGAAGAPTTLAEAQRRLAIQRERRLRLENDAREGALLPVEDVTRSQAAVIAAARARLLAVSHQAVLRGLPAEHAPLIRELVCAALQDLADLRTLAALEAMAEGAA
jgi:hypothetical protein